jgi:hypothetical protein
VLYISSHDTSPFCFSYFSDMVLCFLPEQPQTALLPPTPPTELGLQVFTTMCAPYPACYLTWCFTNFLPKVGSKSHLPTSAGHVADITGMNHHTQFPLCFLRVPSLCSESDNAFLIFLLLPKHILIILWYF